MNTNQVKQALIGLGISTVSWLIANPSLAVLINNVGGSIPATGSAVDFPFNVSVSPSNVADVNLTISSLTVGAGNLSDYELYLLSPSGTSLLLTLADVISGTSFNNVTFDDSAATELPGVGPYSGTFRPQGAAGGIGETANISNLAGFNGSNGNGNWNLRVYNFGANAGNLGSTTLEVVPVPFEFSPTFALGALGLWGIYKAKKKSVKS